MRAPNKSELKLRNEWMRSRPEKTNSRKGEKKSASSLWKKVIVNVGLSSPNSQKSTTSYTTLKPKPCNSIKRKPPNPGSET